MLIILVIMLVDLSLVYLFMEYCFVHSEIFIFTIFLTFIYYHFFIVITLVVVIIINIFNTEVMHYNLRLMKLNMYALGNR